MGFIKEKIRQHLNNFLGSSVFLKFKIQNYKFDVTMKFLRICCGRKEKTVQTKLYKESSKIHVIYRISDAGYPKEKLSCINNENCLKNAGKA